MTINRERIFYWCSYLGPMPAPLDYTDEDFRDRLHGRYNAPGVAKRFGIDHSADGHKFCVFQFNDYDEPVGGVEFIMKVEKKAYRQRAIGSVVVF